MHPQFAELTPTWFNRAFVYTGSTGEFRYRFAGDKDNGVLHTAVYSNLCYELAPDKEERDFPWNEEGVHALKGWLQEKYEAYVSAARRHNRADTTSTEKHPGGVLFVRISPAMCCAAAAPAGASAPDVP